MKPQPTEGVEATARPRQAEERWPELDFARGLVPAVVQDAGTGQVRMLAYVSEESYQRTRESGLATFWSRARGRLWQKGESSGHVLRVVRGIADCDRDALLLEALPAGPTCHSGADSCFAGAPARAPDFLRRLESLIAERDRERPAGSYTAELLAAGSAAAGRKVAEEALECAFAAAFEDRDRLREEAADLVFHLLALLRTRGLSLDDVVAALEARRRGG